MSERSRMGRISQYFSIFCIQQETMIINHFQEITKASITIPSPKGGRETETKGWKGKGDDTTPVAHPKLTKQSWSSIAQHSMQDTSKQIEWSWGQIVQLSQNKQNRLWGIFGMRELADITVGYPKYLNMVIPVSEEENHRAMHTY